jgi:hypothetical protein
VTQLKRLSLAMLLMASALVAGATVATAVATVAPAFAQVGVPSDPDQRWLLGMGTIALTLIIAFLMAWYLPMKRDGAAGFSDRLAKAQDNIPSHGYEERRSLMENLQAETPRAHNSLVGVRVHERCTRRPHLQGLVGRIGHR